MEDVDTSLEMPAELNCDLLPQCALSYTLMLADKLTRAFLQSGARHSMAQVERRQQEVRWHSCR